MKMIPTNKGKFALVDDEDYSDLSQFKWHLSGYGCYAARHRSAAEGGTVERMHRRIMKAPHGIEVDHINRNPLDNRKENLRLCTPSQNIGNQKLRASNRSGFKGVRRHRGKWQAVISKLGAVYCLGTFEDKKHAASIYDQKAIELYGEFALTNKGLGLL